MVTKATKSATCQQVSADAAVVVLNSHFFVNLQEEKTLRIFLIVTFPFDTSSILTFPPNGRGILATERTSSHFLYSALQWLSMGLFTVARVFDFASSQTGRGSDMV